MRVLLAPFFGDNPYQDLLLDAVESTGIETATHADPIPFSPLLFHVLWHDADVLHLHWTHPYFLFGSRRELYRLPLSRAFCVFAALFFLFQLAVISRICDRVVWTAHNKCNHERRYERLDRWVSRRVVGIADAVQVWDDRTREELASYLGVDLDHAVEIPHGNYAPRYDDTVVDRETARKELGVEEYDRVFLYFGLIRPYKRVPTLVETFREEASDGACLVVAGNPVYDDLEREVREAAAGAADIRLDLRYVPDPEVPKLFAACDFGVFPYEEIFNSGAVMLCMTLGRAFVAPAVGSIPSVAPEGNVVYKSLTEGLKTALTYPDERVRAVGDRNYRIARDRYDWDRIGQTIVATYRGH